MRNAGYHLAAGKRPTALRTSSSVQPIRIVGAAPIDKRARAADLKNVANPADHDRPPVTGDDFLAFAFERGDSVGSEYNTACRRHPTPLEIVRTRLDQRPTPEMIRDLGVARGEDADAERRLNRRRWR